MAQRSDLPDREWARRNADALVGLNEYMGISTILLAYADDNLRSRDEIRQGLIDIGFLPAIAEGMVEMLWEGKPKGDDNGEAEHPDTE